MFEKIEIKFSSYVEGHISLSELNETLGSIFLAEHDDDNLLKEIGRDEYETLFDFAHHVEMTIAIASADLVEVSQSKRDHLRGWIIRYLATSAHASNVEWKDPNAGKSQIEDENLVTLGPNISLDTLARMRELGLSIHDIDRATCLENGVKSATFLGRLFSHFFDRHRKFYDEEQDLLIVTRKGDICSISRGKPEE